MNKKIIMPIIGILSVITVIFLIVFAVRVKLIGNQIMEIDYNTEYLEPGYQASFFTKDISSTVKINGSIDTSKLNDYTLIYKAQYGIFFNKKVRHIKVVDKENPIINLKGEENILVCPNKEYIEEGFEAIDNYDGNITEKVSVTNNEYEIIYSVIDSSNNKTEAKRNIKKEDIEKPTITLKGLQAIYIPIGGKYTEPGYDTSDNCGNVNVEIKGNVNTNKKGNYVLEYIATDESGNPTSIKRNVIVFENIGAGTGNPGIIYLTFDDGPLVGTTDKILNILKDEGIKATFFVTSQYGNTDYLIKRAYDEGHIIGLHTNSHKYSQVYSSIEAYYNDLFAIQNRVKAITGYESHIIRFPGGSSNTISKNYTSVIMSYLSKDVIAKGFHYFDWNVGSQDTVCSTSSCVYNNTVNSLSKKRGNYVLMHDIKSTTGNALRDIINYGKANGYVFETITMDTQMNHHGINN